MSTLLRQLPSPRALRRSRKHYGGRALLRGWKEERGWDRASPMLEQFSPPSQPQQEPKSRWHPCSRTGYTIGVFAGPREATLSDGSHIYHIGFHDGASVYVKPETGSVEFPIYEFEEDSEEKMADGFEEWLRASCERARKAFTPAEEIETFALPDPKPEDRDYYWELRAGASPHY